MSDEKCLCCIPIEPGVKVLAGFSVIGTILSASTFWFDKAFFDLFWPIIILYGLMSAIWITNFASPSEGSRKFVFLSFFVLIFLGVASYETWLGLNGDFISYLCNESKLAKMNESLELGADAITTDECKQ